MPGYKVDGSDPLEVYRVVKEARERAIKGDGPTLIEALTNRFTPHSSDDDDKAYRNPEEVKNGRQNDPIVIFGKYLIEVGLLDEPKRKEIEERMKGIVNDATDYAEQAPYAKPEDALKYVYKE